MALKDSFGKVTAHYDKVIVVAVVIGLVGTLTYLAFKVGTDRKEEAAFKVRIANLEPLHPNAVAEDITPYEQAENSIAEPFQLTTWSNAIFVPETRAWCLHCLLPIPMNVEICPFCEAEESPSDVIDITVDKDKDGIKDYWEVEYGMDRYDPRDALKDIDGDGFTALEEFRAEPPTDPTNPTNTPPIEAKLRVAEIVPDPFELRFKSRLELPGGMYKYALNMRGRTYFRKIGEEVNGFTLVNYEENIVRIPVPKSNIPRRVDRSVLTIQRGEKKVLLTRGQDVKYDEYTVHMKFLIDDSTFTVRKDAEFELKVKDASLKYQLIGIDTEREGVVIQRLHDRAKINIWKESDEVFE